VSLGVASESGQTGAVGEILIRPRKSNGSFWQMMVPVIQSAAKHAK